MKINILKSAIGCLTATGFLLSATASYAEDTLRIVSWGGAYQKGPITRNFSASG
jgi:spermidine/putrescine-binding protein